MISTNYYEVYRLLPAAFTEKLRYRSYRFLEDNHLKVSIENYGVIFREEMSGKQTVKAIREHLETDAPPAFEGQPIGISDVIAVTKSGITSAYYVDPTKLILLPDFFHQPASGTLITIDSENLPLDGRKGSWMAIDTLRIDGRDLFLMQSQDYGRDAPYVVVDEHGKELAADKKGFSDAAIEQIRQALKELEALISEAQADAEAIKDELKAVMLERDTEEMDVDVFKIRYKTVKSSRFDTTAFKSTHKELYEQYVKQTESRRFTVSA